jgi:hypothetical protein
MLGHNWGLSPSQALRVFTAIVETEEIIQIIPEVTQSPNLPQPAVDG